MYGGSFNPVVRVMSWANASLNTRSKGNKELKEYPDGGELGMLGHEVFSSMAIFDDPGSPGLVSRSLSRNS